VKTVVASCAIVAAMSAGCGSEHAMHYQIMIDTSLSPTQVEEVMTGGKMWEDAIPGLTLEYVVSPCNDTGNWTHTVCVFLDEGDPSADAHCYHPLVVWSTGLPYLCRG